MQKDNPTAHVPSYPVSSLRSICLRFIADHVIDMDFTNVPIIIAEEIVDAVMLMFKSNRLLPEKLKICEYLLVNLSKEYPPSDGIHLNMSRRSRLYEKHISRTLLDLSDFITVLDVG